jgi:hypothetical protein
MHRLHVPDNPSFLQLMGGVEEYAYPVQDMWPSFWLKAAAVHDGETWRLCYFALVGRWSEAATVEPVQEVRDALAAVSRSLDAAETWALLSTLVTNGTIELAPSVIAHAPDVSVPAPAALPARVPRRT